MTNNHCMMKVMLIGWVCHYMPSYFEQIIPCCKLTGKANERMKPAKSLLKWTFGDKILYSVWMVSIPSVSILSCLWWFGLICRWSKAIFMSLFQCLFLVHCYIVIITRFEADFKMRSSIPMIFPIVFLYLWTQS